MKNYKYEEKYKECLINWKLLNSKHRCVTFTILSALLANAEVTLKNQVKITKKPIRIICTLRGRRERES